MFYCQCCSQPGALCPILPCRVTKQRIPVAATIPNQLGFCMDQPNAMLQPGDINYYDNEYGSGLECLFSCNLDLFDQPDLVVGDDQRDSIKKVPPVT